MTLVHQTEPTEDYQFKNISPAEAARRLGISESKVRRNMQRDYDALMVDEHAKLQFEYGRITMGATGDRKYWINGLAVDAFLKKLAKDTYPVQAIEENKEGK